jgi:hypothetical protein
VALVDDKLQLFLLPFCINAALGVPDDPYSTGKLFAFQGNVVKGVGSLVHIPDNCFNLTTRILVPTVASARALMAADTNPAITFGSYAAGTADTNKVRSRKVCAIPTKYAGYFLSQDDGENPEGISMSSSSSWKQITMQLLSNH